MYALAVSSEEWPGECMDGRAGVPIPRVPTRIGADPGELRCALTRYWIEACVLPAAVRLALVRSISDPAESDRARHRVLKLFALGDADQLVVFEATTRYLRAADRTSALADYRVVDALQWVGRFLTLRPEAAFAALLDLGDESVNSELTYRRAVTSSTAVRKVLDAAGRRSNPVTEEFLNQWASVEAS